MPSDEEFRRVAEDLRGLARSLTRDIRAAADQVKRSAGQAADEQRKRPPQPHDRGRNSWCGPYVGPPLPPHFARHRRRWESKWGTPPPRWWSAPTDEGEQPAASSGDGPATATATMTATPPPPPPPVKRRRAQPPIRHRRDGSTLIGGLALVFGLAWLASRVHLASPSAEAVVAIALMLVGGAMVVTARTDWALSRKAWPALLGGVLVVFALGSSASFGSPVAWEDFRAGDHAVRYTDWSEVPAIFHGGIGNTELDLTSLNQPMPTSRTLKIDAKAASVEVHLPAGLRTVVDSQIGLGSIMVNGQKVDEGVRARTHQVLSSEAGEPTLTLDVSSGIGEVKIDQFDSVKPEQAPPGFEPTTPPTPTTPAEPTTVVGER